MPITNESNLNSVNIIGELNEDFSYSHETRGISFYKSVVRAERSSGTSDLIPITISSKLLPKEGFSKGDQVEIYGEFRSHNKAIGSTGRSKLILEVFVRKIAKSDYGIHFNQISLDGYICKDPEYRTTPFGRKICDILIASNRGNGRSDYLPAITWGRNAEFTKNCLNIGNGVSITGRIQSREYQKVNSEGVPETRIAYEISASEISFTQ